MALISVQLAHNEQHENDIYIFKIYAKMMESNIHPVMDKSLTPNYAPERAKTQNNAVHDHKGTTDKENSETENVILNNSTKTIK